MRDEEEEDVSHGNLGHTPSLDKAISCVLKFHRVSGVSTLLRMAPIVTRNTPALYRWAQLHVQNVRCKQNM